MILRDIQSEARELHHRPAGRLLVITGARQCGKTTLAQMSFPDYPLIALDAPVERLAYAEMSPAAWLTRYPSAILDEVQKMPDLLHTIKACYDRDNQARYVLLGSSQLLLMRQISETLAGRVAIRELYPFSLPELIRLRHPEQASASALLRLLSDACPARVAMEQFSATTSLSVQAAAAMECWQYFQRWGGMPRIAAPEWNDDDRFGWLVDYQNTYLQRDLAELTRLDRLDPFIRAQKAAAMRTAQPINFSELARLSDVSPPTAKEFLRYLEISYQVFLLPGWYRNPEKRLAKQPKLHFIDPGIRRAILQVRGDTSGAEFESAVIAEVFKRIRSARLPVQLSYLRTVDGREVDLLIEREDGFIAIECKQTTNPQPADARHLRHLEELLDKPLLLAIIACNGNYVRDFSNGGRTAVPLLAIPAHLLLA